MSVTSAELLVYGSADMDVLGDGTTIGGAVTTSTIVVPTSASLFNALSDSKVDVVSSNTGDNSQTLTVTGRSDAGSFVLEVISLNGTTLVNGTLTYNRLEKAVLSATCVGTITVTAHTGGTTIFTMAPGVTTMVRPFYNVSADVSGGSQRIYYEKLFFKNTDSTNALLAAQVSLSANPTGDISFWVVTSGVNDTGTTTNRQTAPSGSTFSGTQQGTATTDLAAGAAQGVWFALTLAAGTAATVSTFTPELAGSTT